MDKHIEDLISNPFNTCVIGYNLSRTDKRKTYFLNIKNNRNSEKVFIREEELKEYEELIDLTHKTKTDKKMAAKVARKVKEEEKLRKIEEGIVDEEEEFIEPESDANGKLLIEDEDDEEEVKKDIKGESAE